MILAPHPSLVEQAYEAISGEIADGALEPNTHLVQEELAARYGVSRQPIQQALLLLKSEGIVQDAGRRGLVVAPIDLQMMRDRYEVRAILDGLAARLAARRCAASAIVTTQSGREGDRIIAAGLQAVAGGNIKAMVAHDVAFHGFIYAVSGNPAIAPTAEIHWRFLRRVMGEVLRRSKQAPDIWQQHREILDAIVAGDADAAEERILGHIRNAAGRLAAAATINAQDKGRKPTNGKRRASWPDRNGADD